MYLGGHTKLWLAWFPFIKGTVTLRVGVKENVYNTPHGNLKIFVSYIFLNHAFGTVTFKK